MRMLKKRWLNLETLEDRHAPATFGLPWPDGQHLTLSFAPDGTQVGDRSSELFRLLDGSFGGSDWQQEILRAAQTWAVQGNLNIGLIGDGGQPLGTRGARQGDTRFGDLRLTAVPMSDEVIAIGSPYDVAAGTWSGDVRLNSTYTFGAGTANGQVDLFSVALHELGHALGLDHSDDPASVMNEVIGVHTEPVPADLAKLQALYGTREADEFDARQPNETVADATRISLGQDAISVFEADLTTTADKDLYEFRPGIHTDTLTVRVQTAGLSLLAPRLTVYDNARNVVGTASGSAGDNVEVTLTDVRGNSTYFIQVEGATDDVFAVGGYRLTIERPELPGGSGGAVAALLRNVDHHTNDTLATATHLLQKVYMTDARCDYMYAGSLSDGQDQDYYRFKAPQPNEGAGQVMTVTVWGTQGTLDLRLDVYDTLLRPIAAEVLVNDGGTFTIQVPNAVANAQYLVGVRGAPGSSSWGNYSLAIDFVDHAVELSGLVAGALDQGHPREQFTLTLAESQLFHFVLAAQSPDRPTPLRLVLENEQGRVDTLELAADGTPVSSTQFLAQGTYTFDFVAGDGNPFMPFLFTLRGLGLSDPIGPQPLDSTTDPVSPGTPRQLEGGPTHTHDNPATTVTFVSVQDAYSDPVLPIRNSVVTRPTSVGVTLATGVTAGTSPGIVVATGVAPVRDAVLPAASAGSTALTTPDASNVSQGAASREVSPSLASAPTVNRGDIGSASLLPTHTLSSGPTQAATMAVTTGIPTPTGSDFLRVLTGNNHPESSHGLPEADRSAILPGTPRIGNGPLAPPAQRSSNPTPMRDRGVTENPMTQKENPGIPTHADTTSPPPPAPASAEGSAPPPRPASDATVHPSAAPVQDSASSGEAAGLSSWSSLWRAALALLAAPLALWASPRSSLPFGGQAQPRKEVPVLTPRSE